jgi:uncharacterized phage infection (PIP) family protein YhgE
MPPNENDQTASGQDGYSPPPDPSKPSSDSTGTSMVSLEDYNALQTKFNELQTTHNGLQGYVTKLTKERDTAVDFQNNKLPGYEGQIATLNGQIQDLQAQLETASSGLSEKDAALAEATKKVDMGQLIMEGYNILTHPFAQGLLDPGDREGEELKAYLDSWAETLNNQGKAQRNTDFQGAAPTQPTPDDKREEPVSENPTEVSDAYFKVMSNPTATMEEREAASARYEAAIRGKVYTPS